MYYRLEVKLKGMDTYDPIETYQDRIDPAKLIHIICHLKYDDKQYVMAAVATYK